MRVLGVDYGDSRIGIAVSDLLGITAQGVETITEKDFGTQVAKVEKRQLNSEPRKLFSGCQKIWMAHSESAPKKQKFLPKLSKKNPLCR